MSGRGWLWAVCAFFDAFPELWFSVGGFGFIEWSGLSLLIRFFVLMIFFFGGFLKVCFVCVDVFVLRLVVCGIGYLMCFILLE